MVIRYSLVSSGEQYNELLPNVSSSTDILTNYVAILSFVTCVIVSLTPTLIGNLTASALVGELRARFASD